MHTGTDCGAVAANDGVGKIELTYLFFKRKRDCNQISTKWVVRPGHGYIHTYTHTGQSIVKLSNQLTNYWSRLCMIYTATAAPTAIERSTLANHHRWFFFILEFLKIFWNSCWKYSGIAAQHNCCTNCKQKKNPTKIKWDLRCVSTPYDHFNKQHNLWCVLLVYMLHIYSTTVIRNLLLLCCL